VAPKVRYARSGEVNIAYQVLGDGPIDLVYVMGWVSHLEAFWMDPGQERFFRRLASFSRLILFDKRGTGLSDRVAINQLPTLEERMDDVRAVMDAVGSKQAALFGVSEGGPMCALFSATYPQRTSALIMYGSYAKRVWDPEYPWAPTPEERQRWYDLLEQGWGGVVDINTLAPTAAGDPRFREWWATYLRMSASPGAALALGRMNTQIDIRNVLPAIRVPTLILHRVGDRDIDVGGARYMAEHIPRAKYVELRGDDHLPFVGDQESILDEVEEFLTGARHYYEPDRVLATVLFTDIVGSTERAATLGDRHWRELLELHNRLVSGQLERFGGREVDTAGDGFLATSTALRGRSAAPSPAGTSWRRRASRSKPDSTPGSVSWSATRSGESRSTLELGSLRWQLRARFSYQARSRISSRARAWSSKNVERISSVACQVNAYLRLSCERALEGVAVRSL
jgi:pimeloyl-ACP methyl ester carboxylesterase